MNIRAADPREIDQLAKVWLDAWTDTHAQIVPAELTRLRTLESFEERLKAALPGVRAAGPPGEAVGFCIIKDDELYQLFVATQARGTGVAAALLADAESRLAESGVRTTWLSCAIGNERAARFYEKCGWQRTGTMVDEADISNGPFPLESWCYEKKLTLPD